jgi:hypothetical protein
MTKAITREERLALLAAASGPASEVLGELEAAS